MHWVREKLDDRGKVDENQPDSKKVFGLETAEVVGATARAYGKGVEDLRRKRRGEENEARSMAMYLSRVLGGHKHSEIGGALGLEKTFSVSSACLRMKWRIETEKRLARRARDIQRKPKANLTPLLHDPFASLKMSFSDMRKEHLPMPRPQRRGSLERLKGERSFWTRLMP